MAIMVVYTAPGVTPEAYKPYEDEIRSGPVPPEALLHQVGFDGEGMVVVDIWTSRPAFEAWSRSRIIPTLKAHGFDYTEPRVLDADIVATADADAHFARLKTAARQPV